MFLFAHVTQIAHDVTAALKFSAKMPHSVASLHKVKMFYLFLVALVAQTFSPTTFVNIK